VFGLPETPSLRLVVCVPSGRCGHARAAQHAMRYAMQGTAEKGAGEEERRRDEGTGEGAKEVARTAGGEAAGARSRGNLTIFQVLEF